MNSDNQNNLEKEHKKIAIEVALEEYKTLRAEILMLQQNCNNLLVFGFAALTTIIGIAITPLSKVSIQEVKTTPEVSQTEFNNSVKSNLPSAIILCAIVPLSCGCLTIVWLNNNKKVYLVSRHIANNIENKINQIYLELNDTTKQPLIWESDRQKGKFDFETNKSILVLFGLIALSSSAGGAVLITSATVNYYLNIFWLPSLISLLYFTYFYFSKVSKIDSIIKKDKKEQPQFLTETNAELAKITPHLTQIKTQPEAEKEKMSMLPPVVEMPVKVDKQDLHIEENQESELKIKPQIEEEIQSETIAETPAKPKVKSKPFFLKSTTLILVILALILGGVVYYTENQKNNQQETVQKKQKKIFNFTEAEIKNLKIEKETETIELERTNDPTKPWQMKQPNNVPASDAVVSYLSNLLVNGQSDRSFIIPPNQKQDYGLDKPLTKVKIQLTNQNTHELILGKTNFDNQFIYAEVDPPTDSNKDIEIFLVPLDFQYAVERKIEEWKEKNVTPKKEEPKPKPDSSPKATTKPSNTQSPSPKPEQNSQNKETPKPLNSQSSNPKPEQKSQSKETPKPSTTQSPSP